MCHTYHFVKITIQSEDIKRTWIKVNLKEINDLIINQNFLVKETEKGEPVTRCM